MQIQGPGPLSGPDKIPDRVTSSRSSGPSRAPRAGEDRVELSATARYLEKLENLPIRAEKVESLREAIESGKYSMDEEKLRVVADRMLEDMEDLGLV